MDTLRICADAIVLEHVSKVFRHRPALFNWIGYERSGATRALADVSLTIFRGTVHVLLGPNGSGKTTLLKLISTSLLPDSGRVIVLGSETQSGGTQVRRQVGLAVPTERSFCPRLTARENLDFFAALDAVPRCIRSQRIDEVLESVRLSAMADTVVMKHSSGMYQRLGIARALLKKPSVLLLDEPSRSLDQASAEGLWSLICSLQQQGTTVLLASHNFEEAAAVGNSVSVLREGKLAGQIRLHAKPTADELRDSYSRLLARTMAADVPQYELEPDYDFAAG